MASPDLVCGWKGCSYSTRQKGHLKRHMNGHVENLMKQREPPDVTPDFPPSHSLISRLEDPRNIKHKDVLGEYSVSVYREQHHSLESDYFDLDVTFCPRGRIEDPFQLLDFLHKVFDNIIHCLTKDVSEDSFVRAVLREPELLTPVSTRFVRLRDFSTEILLDKLSNVLQSKKFFRLEFLQANFIVQKYIRKGGIGGPVSGYPNDRLYAHIPDYMRQRKCILSVPSADGCCLARSILCGKRLLDFPGASPQNYIHSTGATLDAQALHEKAGIRLGLCGIPEARIFQQNLPDLELNIFNGHRLFKREFRGPPNDSKINLAFWNSHFWVITSLAKFWARKNFCYECGEPYDVLHKSKTCPFKGCSLCKKPSCENRSTFRGSSKLPCMDCNGTYFNRYCLIAHEESGECEKFFYCKHCRQKVRRNRAEKHVDVCGYRFCKPCGQLMHPSHRFCFIKKHTKKNKFMEQNGPKLTTWFYDIECEICGGGIHKPNLLVMIREDEGAEFIFEGPSCLKKFLDHILREKVAKNEERLYLAHNARSYDSFVLLKEFFRRDLCPKLLVRDNQILEMKLAKSKVIFRDSLSYIGLPLRSFEKAFNLDVCKGFFPLLMNSAYNLALAPEELLPKGSFPSLDLFMPQDSAAKDLKELKKWHEEQVELYRREQKQWNLRENLIFYCRQDTLVLLRGSRMFRKIFNDLASKDLDIYYDAPTLSAASHLAYRHSWYRDVEYPLLVVSDNGIDPKTKHSWASSLWLDFLELEEGLPIQREFPVGKYKLDGAVETEDYMITFPDVKGKVALEFQGCTFHGHDHIPRECVEPLTGKTMSQLKKATEEKNRFLRDRGWKIVEMWACQFEEELKTNEKLKNFVREHQRCTHGSIRPREGLFGGRTNLLKLYAKCEEDEEIVQYDVVSLYPTMNCEKFFPFGEPEILSNVLPQDIGNYWGLIQCQVLCPKGLYLPVLPYRHNNSKLMFPACRSCCDELSQNQNCEHSQEERSWLGVYTSMELSAARDRGYRVLHVCQVWHWPIQRRTKEMFAPYLLHWLGAKLKSSGFPPEITSDEQKEEMVGQLNERYGLNLDWREFELNPPMFCQRTHLLQTTFSDSLSEIRELFENPNISVHELVPVSDELVMVCWKHKKDFQTVAGNLSLIIGIYTTAYARLHLLVLLEDCLRRYGRDSLLYFDTDGFFVKRKRNAEPIVCGPYMGDLKNETLENYGDGARGVEFWASAPKSYGLKIQTAGGEQFWNHKIKGFKINARSSEVLNPEAVLDKLLKDFRNEQREEEDLVVEYPYQMKRSLRKGGVFTAPIRKRFSISYDKRIIVENFGTLPYGFS